jgi:hypothetical protein
MDAPLIAAEDALAWVLNRAAKDVWRVRMVRSSQRRSVVGCS